MSKVQLTTGEESPVKELVAEIKALIGETASLREDVKQNKGNRGAQGKS